MYDIHGICNVYRLCPRIASGTCPGWADDHGESRVHPAPDGLNLNRREANLVFLWSVLTLGQGDTIRNNNSVEENKYVNVNNKQNRQR